MSSIEYHQGELNIALDPTDRRHSLPFVKDSDRRILDIGCGIGQSFIALNCTDKVCVGLDVDEDAVKHGIEAYGDKIQFILADAKKIPLPSNTFDLVFSRVSLPYTNIPKSIKEIKRVLQQDGRFWFTLHDKSVAYRYLAEAARGENIKRLVHSVYILANGYLLKYLGILVPFFQKGYESWQDKETMICLLQKQGFSVEAKKVNGQSIIEGTLSCNQRGQKGSDTIEKPYGPTT